MAEILFAVSPSVLSWIVLVRGPPSAAFLLLHTEKFVLWLIPCRAHPARVAVVALVVSGLIDICSECRMARVTWRHLSSSPLYVVMKLSTVDVFLNANLNKITYLRLDTWYIQFLTLTCKALYENMHIVKFQKVFASKRLHNVAT